MMSRLSAMNVLGIRSAVISDTRKWSITSKGIILESKKGMKNVVSSHLTELMHMSSPSANTW
jgi:hypothetical protein